MRAPILVALVAVPAVVRAQAVSLQAEAGAASFVAGPQTERFGAGGGGALRLELPLFSMLSLQAGAGVTGFSNGPAPTETADLEDPGVGASLQAGGGLRVRPLPGFDRLWLDADASYVRTGPLGRFGLDGGLGYDVFASGSLRGAPFVRYTHVFQPAGGLEAADGQIAMVGIALTWGRATDARIRSADVAPEGEDEQRGDFDRLLGVANEDRCPDGAEDPDGFDDADGCPDDDNDRDGIADATDACPLEAEVVNGVDDADGCPDEGLVAVVDDTIVLSERIFFETSKARIRGRSRPILEAVAALLVARPDFTRVRIEGHADDRGNARYNQDLSQRRAEKVVQRLVSLGVDATRLEFVGFGRARPWQRGTSPSARQANRRVEFRILETADGTPPNRTGVVGAVAAQAGP